MNYQETIHYLFNRLPVFTRDGASAFKKDLANTIKLCAALGNPEVDMPAVHVAGTNGKGSTSHALAAILQRAGFRTGLYTSPHLVDFRERIRINGSPVPEQVVVDFVATHRALIESVQPSFFELTVAMAFDFFAQAKVDIAVIETGLGGRLDSTNVVHPVCSVITNIGWDHADILGDTLAKIAEEKAGIIKAGVPVVISEYQESIAPVFERKATTMRAPLIFASRAREVVCQQGDGSRQDITVRINPLDHRADAEAGQLTKAGETFRLDLLGNYQSKNLLGILSAVDVLRSQGWRIPPQALFGGLAHVQALTGLQGRWQTLAQDPLIIADTGHNEDGWRVVLENIRLTPHRQTRMVIGVMKDKDLSKMLPLLPNDARYYFCQVRSLVRALPAADLKATARTYGLQGEVYASVSEAVSAARSDSQPEDLIFVGGSTFIVGELLSEWTA